MSRSDRGDLPNLPTHLPTPVIKGGQLQATAGAASSDLPTLPTSFWDFSPTYAGTGTRAGARASVCDYKKWVGKLGRLGKKATGHGWRGFQPAYPFAYPCVLAQGVGK